MNNFSIILDWVSTPTTSRLILILILTYLVFLWIAIVVWTAKDIISRTNNLALQILSIALSVILNVFGLILYMAIRPSKTLIAKFFEDLEYEALVEEANRTTWGQEKEEKKKKKIAKKTKKKNEKKQKKSQKRTQKNVKGKSDKTPNKPTKKKTIIKTKKASKTSTSKSKKS